MDLDNDMQLFAETMTAIAEVYGKPLSQGMLEIYWTVLSRYPIETVVQALHWHIANPDVGQFLPKPADIVRTIEGTSGDAAATAWAQLDRAVRRIGTWRDVVFPDPLIHRVVYDMGGWVGFGDKSEDEWPFVAKDFQARYRAYRSRGMVPEYPPKLIGRANRGNGAAGYALEPPAYAGPEELCRRVEQGGQTRIGFDAENPVKSLGGRLEHLHGST